LLFFRPFVSCVFNEGFVRVDRPREYGCLERLLSPDSSRNKIFAITNSRHLRQLLGKRLCDLRCRRWFEPLPLIPNPLQMPSTIKCGVRPTGGLWTGLQGILLGIFSLRLFCSMRGQAGGGHATYVIYS